MAICPARSGCSCFRNDVGGQCAYFPFAIRRCSCQLRLLGPVFRDSTTPLSWCPGRRLFRASLVHEVNPPRGCKGKSGRKHRGGGVRRSCGTKQVRRVQRATNRMDIGISVAITIETKITLDSPAMQARGTGASTAQLTERAAERLAKYNIEDFVALTDRMSIHKDVLPERIKYIDQYVDDINKAELDDISELEVYLSQKTVRRDPELRRIMDIVDSEVAKGNGGKVMGDVLTSQEQIYITNRGLEDQLRRELGTQGNRAQLFEQTLPSTKRAMLPEELRSETGARIFGSDKVEKATRSQSILGSTKNAGVAALRYADAITPGDAAKFMKETGQKIKIVAPKASRTEMVAVNRAVEQARDSVVRLERSLPEAMAIYGRYTTKPDEAIYSMFNRSATTDPTDILQMGDDAARMAFRMGKNNPLTNEQVLQVARGTLPTLTKADEAFILAKIGMNPVESVAKVPHVCT